MFIRPLLRRAGPLAAGLSTCATASTHIVRADDDGKRKPRVYTLPASKEPQLNASHAPSWDWNWDYRDLSAREIAEELAHEWPLDYPAAIRKLYADHSDKAADAVEKLIDKHRDDLPALYRRAYREHAFGGAKVRHILLVRHGQYEEQRDLCRELEAADEWQVKLEEFQQSGPSFELVNSRQVLTPLGREQAARAGERLAAMLKPVLQTAGREGDVRIRVSTLTRAMETADIIAAQLPASAQRAAPDAGLSEGCPPAHDMPTEWAQPDGVYYEGARIEAAFRRIFYRSLPRKADALAAAIAKAQGTAAASAESATHAAQAGDDGGARAPSPAHPKHEYEIVVCHCNVIRFFMLRALQLPPECWLRLGGVNGSITHLRISTDGRVCLEAFGDGGHLSLEETTFGRAQGWE